MDDDDKKKYWKMQQPNLGRQAGRAWRVVLPTLVSSGWPAIRNTRWTASFWHGRQHGRGRRLPYDGRRGLLNRRLLKSRRKKSGRKQEKLFTQDDEGDDYSLDFASINEDDSMYAVPEDDTADFVGIGSLGHIIRKCFKELYRPGQDEDDMLLKKVTGRNGGRGRRKVTSRRRYLGSGVDGELSLETRRAKEEKKDDGNEDVVGEEAVGRSGWRRKRTKTDAPPRGSERGKGRRRRRVCCREQAQHGQDKQ